MRWLLSLLIIALLAAGCSPIPKTRAEAKQRLLGQPIKGSWSGLHGTSTNQDGGEFLARIQPVLNGDKKPLQVNGEDVAFIEGTVTSWSGHGKGRITGMMIGYRFELTISYESKRVVQYTGSLEQVENRFLTVLWANYPEGYRGSIALDSETPVKDAKTRFDQKLAKLGK